MALSPRQREALIGAEQRTRADIRDRLVAYATSLWGSLGSWRDADVDRFVDQLAPRVMAGQQAVASLTDAYLATLTGTSPGALTDLGALRAGVGLDDVYRRPAVEMYTALATGASMTDALSKASNRLADLVRTDLQLSMRAQARESMSRLDGVGGFRRTLTGAENCALCAIASTQRYHRGNLMPIHPGCDCGVEPLDRRTVHAQVIDPELLDRVHEQVASFAGRADLGARNLGIGKTNARGERLSDYTDLLITRQHGELGPVLTWRHQNFTGPSDLAA